jgi:hypothetical protein
MRRKLVFFAFSLGLASLALVHRAEAASCTPGSTRIFRTGSCCSFDRERNEIYVCSESGVFWVPSGEYTCSGPCVEF